MNHLSVNGRNITYPNIFQTMVNEAEKGVSSLTHDGINFAIAVLTFLTGLIGKNVFSGLSKWLKAKQSKQMFANLEEMKEAYYVSEQITYNTEVERFIIFRGSNGGSIPQIGKPYYVSAIHGKTDVPIKVVQDKFHSLQIDACYIDMLLTMKQNGFIKYEVSKMKDCLLKQIYESEKITYSELYFLANSSKEIFYCSVAKHGDVGFDIHTRGEISAAVSQLRGIFSKHYN